MSNPNIDAVNLELSWDGSSKPENRQQTSQNLLHVSSLIY